MSEFTMLAALAVLAAVAFVLYPLARPGVADGRPRVVDELAARRAVLYHEVLDLEFDQRMGKLSPADAQAMRAELLRQAGALLRQADTSVQELDARIEEEIAAARAELAARERAVATPGAGVEST